MANKRIPRRLGRVRAWGCSLVLALAVVLAGCAGQMTVRIQEPMEGRITINEKIVCRLPCTLKLSTGYHRVVLDLQQRRESQRFFGVLHVRPPTENAKLGVVPLTIHPVRLQQAFRTQRVLEAFTYDQSAQLRELLRIRLGLKRPW